jgi:hypothetical protein
MVRPFISGFTRANPVVYFLLAELPQTTHLVSGHLFAIDPLVDRISLNTEVIRDFVHGQPSIQRVLQDPNLRSSEASERTTFLTA